MAHIGHVHKLNLGDLDQSDLITLSVQSNLAFVNVPILTFRRSGAFLA